MVYNPICLPEQMPPSKLNQFGSAIVIAYKPVTTNPKKAEGIFLSLSGFPFCRLDLPDLECNRYGKGALVNITIPIKSHWNFTFL